MLGTCVVYWLLLLVSFIGELLLRAVWECDGPESADDTREAGATGRSSAALSCACVIDYIVLSPTLTCYRRCGVAALQDARVSSLGEYEEVDHDDHYHQVPDEHHVVLVHFEHAWWVRGSIRPLAIPFLKNHVW